MVIGYDKVEASALKRSLGPIESVESALDHWIRGNLSGEIPMMKEIYARGQPAVRRLKANKSCYVLVSKESRTFLLDEL